MTRTATIPEHGYTSGNYSPLYVIVRHLVDFLKWRFSLAPRGAYHWVGEVDTSPEQSGTEIFIAADTPLHEESVGQRPAITVLRSHASFQGVGLGDLAYVDLASGSKARMDLIPTTVVIAALSKIPVECETLAWVISDQIFSLREEIIRTEPSLLYIGSRASIAPPTPAGSLMAGSTAHEWTAVTLSYPTYLQHNVGTVPLGKAVISKWGITTNTAEATSKVTSVLYPLQGSAVNQPKQK